MGEEVQRLMDKKLQEGILEATVAYIKNVMATFNVSAEKAMDALGIPPSQRRTYVELIGKV